jgi:hypothetical protein
MQFVRNDSCCTYNDRSGVHRCYCHCCFTSVTNSVLLFHFSRYIKFSNYQNLVCRDQLKRLLLVFSKSVKSGRLCETVLSVSIPLPQYNVPDYSLRPLMDCTVLIVGSFLI